jgi:hypothetical protein
MPTKADEIFREFNRYTGDGKPGEPVAAPLPIGDPSSGVKHLKKREFREWANDFSEDMGGFIGQAEVWAGEANDAAEQTALDRIATGEDATATGEDAAQTALDRIATGADATQTALDRVATGADVTQTALDRIATGADAVATADDRVQTGLDRTAASTSASDADTARIAAELAQSNAEGILDSFDDRYLGVKAVAPTVDNDGDPLVIGALYYNSTDNQMLIYNGASWEGLAAGIELALKKANNLSDVSSPSASRTNLGLGSAAVEPTSAFATAAQGAKADAAIPAPIAPADGDILIRSGGAWARLSKGADGQVLALDSGLPAWADAASPVKAWVNFNGTGTVAIRDSFNVSSITDNGVGDYTVNFATAMSDANYAMAGSCNQTNNGLDLSTVVISGTNSSTSVTTGSIRVAVGTAGVGRQDASDVNLIFTR